jgi:GNAT superfamily N-acetyltransferase
MVKQIRPDEAMTFCEIFMTAFEMPVDFAPAMAQLLTPSIGLPNFFHYLAFVDDEPVGTLILICHRGVGFVGATGVIPEHRGGGASYNLIIQAGHDAQHLGCDALVLQTTAGTKLERYLRMAGFKRTFTRTNYTLS